MAVIIIGAVYVVISAFGCNAVSLNQRPFPDDFQFGAATASYQVEGGWNADGKGENIWDKFTHEHPEKIINGANGDIACDSYHKYKEDVKLAAALRLNYYRLSISWSRIMPTGYTNQINQAGIDYYNNLIDELLAKGIEPMVTIYHWDLPEPLQEIGGWPSESIINYFVDYASVVFEHFGDRVKKWITFNEPKQFCKIGYALGIFAPGDNSSAIGDYICSKTLLQSHARVYHMYQKYFKPTQGGLIGFTMNVNWGEPNTTSKEDIEAADRLFEFRLGWYGNPIYGSGDYPKVIKDFICRRSAAQGFRRCRLPPLCDRDVRLLKGSADFFGLNSYSTNMVADAEPEPLSVVSGDSDARVNYWQDKSWPGASSPWLKIVPWGMRKILRKIKDKYGDVPIYITENGYSDYGELNDTRRIYYMLTYLSNVLDAIYLDKVNVKAYTYWSLLDNFEWSAGYSQKFGLHYVDFTSLNRTRIAKQSASVFREIIETRKLPKEVPALSSTRSKIHNRSKNGTHIYEHEERN